MLSQLKGGSYDQTLSWRVCRVKPTLPSSFREAPLVVEEFLWHQDRIGPMNSGWDHIFVVTAEGDRNIHYTSLTGDMRDVTQGTAPDRSCLKLTGEAGGLPRLFLSSTGLRLRLTGRVYGRMSKS